MDRRQAKTRHAIIDAFVRLLSKSSYEKITVKDIIDEANIGRSTFYSHFETKDELARKMCNMLFQHTFAHTIPVCSTHNFSDLPQNAENRIAHILYHLRDKKQYYLGIIRYDDGNLFLRFFREYMLENLSIMINPKCTDAFKNIPQEFIIAILTSSFIGMLQWWLQNDMKQTPEELSAQYITMINPAITEVAIKE